MLIPERRVCDFCGKDNPEHTELALPVKTDWDWTETRRTGGAYRIETLEVDICEECLLQATNIYADFQGSNPRICYKGTTIRRGNP